MKEPRISAVLLAAGLSTRMEGENKMLLPFQQTIIIQHVYNQLLDGGVSEIIVVGGRNFEGLQEVLRLRESDQLVFNEEFESGMTSSIQAGVRKASGDAFMICLGDMPLLSGDHYKSISAFFSKTHRVDNHCIVIPETNGKRGNPVVFSKHYLAEILNNQEHNGCKSVIENNREHVVKFENKSAKFLMDIDTPEDYQQLLHETN